ncbi:uncharacterized protein LOC114401926 [Glycine soja]|uniref:uncharacterized protein LOC114401926 n=1 Tax=Glycine soja TaxID=3848 RepID=UPI00103DD6DF|nr:uncharacterized protein LOC114401926 [Glycine soja]
MSEEVDMNVKNKEDASVKVKHVDCSDAFNTSQLFVSRDEVLQWSQSLAHDIGFVAVIMRYKLSLLDIVGVTPTRMTFSAAFAYLEEELKTVFSDATNLLCRFHIDKNVKAKCKTLVSQKNAWDYVMEDSIENIIDVKADGNCGYRAITTLLGMGEELWSLVRNHLHKELTSWSEEYIHLVGGIEKFEELKCSLLVDGLSIVTMDKWMNIIDMGYVIASRYSVIIVSLLQQQSMTFFL